MKNCCIFARMRRRGYQAFLMVLACWALYAPTFSMQDFRERPDVNLHVVPQIDAHSLQVPLFYECEESKEKTNTQTSLVTVYWTERFLKTFFTPLHNRFDQVNFPHAHSMGLYLTLGVLRL